MIYFIGFTVAAIFEILGCWLMLRFLSNHEPMYLIASVISLVLFAVVVSLADVGIPGRTYAVYGGIYISFAMFFFAFSQGALVSRYDLFGALLSISGALVIFLGSGKATQ